ncbi:PBSX family phage terminase large subunit [Methylorubrum populi]|uniref:Phage terminase large subunit n=1 Tax=Methylorubrum populi TaxID=223967 RepID=A0A833MWE7_9HYPH|nr:PBSX family phage terminase large subunit [Methylorubrum populi]KAB7782156.1 Phage terminase large subunit [Methylorubrum populi]
MDPSATASPSPSSTAPATRAEFPRKLAFLFQPKRYKIAKGGRGGGKSWAFARALLILGASRKLRILCAREFQNSTADSVHALLKDQIEKLGLDGFYEVQQTRIIGANGTEFSFEGLRHNVTKIKSYEGVDICWVEEARTVSKASWDVLIPTIRKPGSEIWISFNPELADDETYKRFVKHPPTNSVVETINWYDNPWFPVELQQEAKDLRARDPIAYETVWEGHCKQVLDGAIFSNEILAATRTGRFTSVPFVPDLPVHVFSDLGRADKTSMWFVQVVGLEFRLLAFYENRGFFWEHYLDKLRALKEERGYSYGEIWLPHDAQNELLASKRTIEQQTRDAGYRVRIVPKLSVAGGIDAARQVFGRCFFDEDLCADGLQALRNYRYEVDPATQQFSKNPLHDWASHGADAFRYFAVGIAEPRAPAEPVSGPNDVYARRRRERSSSTSGSGWAA